MNTWKLETRHNTQENVTCKVRGKEITVVDMDSWCSCHLAPIIHLYLSTTTKDTHESEPVTYDCNCGIPSDGAKTGECVPGGKVEQRRVCPTGDRL